jgi:hypothetical protein
MRLPRCWQMATATPTQSTMPGGRAAARIDPSGQLGAEAPLDLHKGIDDVGAAKAGCLRWPAGLYLLREATGELLAGRCRSTNLCPYCRKLGVLETVEMWTLDALEHAPSLYVVLTSREHLTRADCRRHLTQLLRAARRVWTGCEWCVSVEFQRKGRLHLNLLVKGVPIGDCERFRAVVIDGVWCARVDALPIAQYCAAIADGVGVVRYINEKMAHGLKSEQAPPLGWRGHRTSQTRGYLVRPASVMREEARRSLRISREVWRGHELAEAIAIVDAADGESWELVDTRDRSRKALRADAMRPLRIAAIRRRAAVAQNGGS